MINKEIALSLALGTVLYRSNEQNLDNTPQRWKVNGRCRVWKREPMFFELPIKRGAYQFDYVNPGNARFFHPSELEAFESYYLDLGHAENTAATLAKVASIYHRECSHINVADFCIKILQSEIIRNNEELLQLLQEFYLIPENKVHEIISRYGFKTV